MLKIYSFLVPIYVSIMTAVEIFGQKLRFFTPDPGLICTPLRRHGVLPHQTRVSIMPVRYIFYGVINIIVGWCVSGGPDGSGFLRWTSGILPHLY
jgi:hypothetical protein